MRFEFATAGRILFGPGTMLQAAPAAATLGSRALLVTGRNPARSRVLLEKLSESGVTAATFAVNGEPDLATISAGVEHAREHGCDLIISMGGGSALDAGKAIAAMLTNPGDLLDYLEVIGRGRPLPNAPAPFIAVPTTAGTGSEATRNAVLASPEHRVKVSLRSPWMLPRLAIVDPELTFGLPPDLTAATGLDALTQLIEPFVSTRANPIVDALCLRGLPLAATALPRAVADGRDAAARADMSLASLYGGIALANAGLGAVHGFAGPIGGMFSAPHGALCAALLPHVAEANIRAIRDRQPASPTRERFATVARLLTGNPSAQAEDSINWLRRLNSELKIPPLRVYGIAPADLEGIVANATRASSMKTNPVALTETELRSVLGAAL